MANFRLLIAAMPILLITSGCGEAGLPPVSDTRPSQDERILNAGNLMSDGSPLAPHITSTFMTSIEIKSTGLVGGTTIAQDGTIFTANFDSSVWRTLADGTTTLLTDAFSQASGNYALSDGSLLQCDYKENKIYRVQPDGSRNVFSEAGLDGPVGLTQLSTGDIIVANHRGKFLARVSANGGAATQYFAEVRLEQPNGVVAGTDDVIYISDLSRGDVFSLTSDLEFTVLATLPGRGNAHSAIANGGLYVNKIWDHVVYRVKLDSGAFGIVSGTGQAGYEDGSSGQASIEEPNGIAASADGNSVFVNTHRGTMGLGNPGVIVLREIALAD